MSQFLASHPMENFFINPTMTQDNSMETFARISVMSETPRVRFDGLPLDATVEPPKTIRPVSTIQDLFLAHNFRTGYSSEEESASPRGSSDDNLSLHSDDGEIVTASALPVLDLDPRAATPAAQNELSAIDRFLVPEELASSCTKIEHRCNRAQAVVLKPVGKPKMVSMPRLVDIPARPSHVKRPSNESFANSTRSASLRRAESRRSVQSTASTRFSHDAEAMPSVPSSLLPTPAEEKGRESPPDPETPMVVDEPQVSPTRSPIRNSAAFDPFPRLADIAAGNMDAPSVAVKRSMTVSGAERQNADSTSTPPMTPAKRRLHRLASTISNASELVRRKSSISSMRKPATPTSSVAPSPRPSLLFSGEHSSPSIPRRSSSMGKLTPRGATERAPILVLPPFPSEDDEEEDDDFGDASNERGLQKWDRPRARQVAKLTKTRPTIDGVVNASRV